MSKIIYKVSLIAKTPILIGGVTTDPIVDAVSALNESGKPFITASAFKGALRGEFEKFLKLQGENVETNWVGEAYKSTREKTYSKFLNLLFAGGEMSPRLRFFDLHSYDEPQFIERTGVAISRKLGTAVPRKLFIRKFIDKGTKFDGKIELIVDEEISEGVINLWENFLTYISYTGISIGNSKSYGMGNLSVKVEREKKDNELSIGVPNRSGPWKLFKVTIEMQEPINLGYRRFRYMLPSLRFIPGSTIRGAFAYALLRVGVSEHVVEEMFVKGSYGNKLRFSNFYNIHLDYKSNIEPYCPNFATLRRKKGGKNVIDTMIHEYLLFKNLRYSENLNLKLFELAFGSSLPLIPLSPDHGKFNVGLLTKLTVDRKTGAAHPTRLYTVEALLKPLKMIGIVKAPESWWKKRSEFEDLELLIGGRKLKGFGMAKIVNISPIDDELMSYEDRTDKLTDKIKSFAKNHDVKIAENRKYFTIDLLSDVVTPEITNGNHSSLSNYINKSFENTNTKIEMAWISTDMRGGFDQLKSRNQGEPIFKNRIGLIKRGSVILLSTPENEWIYVRRILDKFIENGFGVRTEEGYGFITVSHSVHYLNISEEV